MKLSKGLIAGILEKERKTNPKVHYISDITKANDFAEVVRIFNGRSIMAYGIEEIHEITAESNSLVIGLETLDNGKILAMERALRIAKKREVPVLLDLSGVNLSLYRKNTALSFLNRYTIDLVKGTVEEVQALIRSQKRNRCKEKNIKAEYRDFAIKNKVFLLVESEEYYITDGYSEFYIKNKNKYFNDEEYIDNIYTGVLASSIGICNNKSEIIQSVLISTLSFYIAQEDSIELFKYQFEDDIDKNDINLVNEYLLEEISKINVDKIKSYGDVEYYFKRNR